MRKNTLNREKVTYVRARTFRNKRAIRIDDCAPDQCGGKLYGESKQVKGARQPQHNEDKKVKVLKVPFFVRKNRYSLIGPRSIKQVIGDVQ
ncbi:MAG: hypothetical protein ABJP66_20700 [Hyphomicrobiales bacterium]